jgi:membrane protease YdiL (CAAX protease family)
MTKRKLLTFALSGTIQEEEKELTLSIFLRLFFIKFYLLGLYIGLVTIVFGLGEFSNIEQRAGSSIVHTFVNFIVLAPILEELIFRNHLSLKLENILLALLLSIILFWGDWFIVILLWYFILVGYTRIRKIFISRLLLIYSSSIIFAFAHHYQIIDWNNSGTIVDFFLKSVPQFIGGLFYCYIYFRNGVIVSMLFHAFWNLLPFLSECLRIASEVP